VQDSIQQADGSFASRRLTNLDMLSRHFSTKPICALTGDGGSMRWPTVCVALLFLLPTFSLNGRESGEDEVKAAFLLNFAKFVEWPSKAFHDSKAPFVIGIVGADPFGDALLQIVKGQTAQRRRIEIRHFKLAEDCGDCHLLFLSRSLVAQTDHILKRLEGRPVLTVSEKENFVRQGGVIGFAVVDKSVRFDINAKAAAAADLKVSSKLLAVAREVLQSL
jgi:hypothetical protein